MIKESSSAMPPTSPAGNGWRTFGIVVITMAVTLGVGYWAVNAYLFPDAFKPVQLSEKEQQRLDRKLQKLAGGAPSPTPSRLEPEAYSEAGASREIHLSEKELNALLSKNTDLASRLAIDLSENLASAKLLVHLDPDFPFLGGNTIKINAGMELRLLDGRPVATLRGVSVWGVPLPNAWMGNMKNTNLIEEFGQAGGFWQAINEGVEELEVKDGELRIKLKE
ncbi:MAG: arginine N-succinyltransferase [Gammaproteobacteria bacterium]|nr:arginine N-succinyltransferase [Gammaproteobacteria bacterium]